MMRSSAKAGWCDDGGTRQTESCEDAIALALDRALAWITRRQGPDIESWQWGIEHDAAHRHPMFDGVPLLRDIASVRFPSDGGAQTLNRAQPSYRGRRPFEAIHGAGYRGVYDFSDLDNSRFAMPLGQSGNMLSPWARNFVQRWQNLSYIEIAAPAPSSAAAPSARSRWRHGALIMVFRTARVPARLMIMSARDARGPEELTTPDATRYRNHVRR